MRPRLHTAIRMRRTRHGVRVQTRSGKRKVRGWDYALPLSVASGASFRVLPVELLRPLVMLTDLLCDVVMPAVSPDELVAPIETENRSEVPRTTVTCLSLSLGSSITALLGTSVLSLMKYHVQFKAETPAK